MDKLTPQSPDLTAQNVAKIAELFPGVVTETLGSDAMPTTGINFDLLQQELSGHLVEGPQERYQLDWPGKRAAVFAANAPISKTLRPVRELSVDFDTTKNLFIEGDNLDALKLLSEPYLGKVKMIFIDPPYNTGSDRFVYDDNFSETSEEYLRRSGQENDLGERLRSNVNSNGRFHSDWLSMMYPRLKLARSLLRDDGVLFVSIGDTEGAALKLLLDEAMGPGNFVSTVVWQKVYSPMNSATQFASVHDYVHVYARNAATWASNLLPRTEDQDAAYKNPDRDPRGRWKPADATAAAGHATESQFYELETPSGQRFTPPTGRAWVYTKLRFAEMVADNRVWFGADGQGRPAIKRFLDEVKQGRVAQSFWPYTEVGHNQEAKKELIARVEFDESEPVFDTPKPTRLVRRMLELATTANSDDIVLDFFAGSGTTADAVLQQNASDGGSRRFILVQVADQEVGRALGVTDVARARITKAGAELRTDTLDVGFRYLRVDSSGLADVERTADDLVQSAIADFSQNVRPDRSADDLLFQVLVSWGLDPSLPIETVTAIGLPVFSVDNDALVACFEQSVPADAIRAIAERHPLRAVFRDSAFTDDAARINAEQMFAEISPETDVKVI